jgi:hypothetical protein
MDEKDNELLNKSTSRFASDLDLKEVLPILTESKFITPMTEAEKNAAKYSRLVVIINLRFVFHTINFQQLDRMCTQIYSAFM